VIKDLTPAREIVDSPLAVADASSKKLLEAAASKLGASKAVKLATEMLKAVSDLEAEEPKFKDKMPSAQLTKIRNRGKLIVAMNWFVNQLNSIEGCTNPQAVYDVIDDMQKKLKDKGFGSKVCSPIDVGTALSRKPITLPLPRNNPPPSGVFDQWWFVFRTPFSQTVLRRPSGPP
jgi:hypothetical protein